MDHSVQKTTPYRVISVLLLVVLAVLMIFPLYWIITGSFKDARTINSATPVWFPVNPTTDNYTRLFERPAGIWMFNTVFMCVMSMLLTCVAAAMGGYALAKKAVEEHTLAEAVLLGSDEVAEGALEAFRELGVRVPKDVAVIIYQDIQTLESKWPTGTCLEMFPDYVWENALELLFGRISQRRSQAVTVTVPTHLKIGDTA